MKSVFQPKPEADLFHCFAGHLQGAAEISAIGVASAFVSTYGIKRLIDLWKSIGSPACHTILGIDRHVTHPGAIVMAAESGMDVRLGKASQAGIFHPKFVVGGTAWSGSGDLSEPSFLYVGSANLTYRGILANSEVGFLATSPDIPPEAGTIFGNLWRESIQATPEAVAAYEMRFSATNALRGPRDLDDLEISESVSADGLTENIVAGLDEPEESIQSPAQAVGAWAGLQSLTGGYLQVEFPRDAAQVLRHRLGDYARLQVLCTDGEHREMIFAYYAANAMYRLNVPSTTPQAEWVRNNRQGIAVVEVLNGAVSLRLLRPGSEADQVIAKSAALGSWGKTPTRLYGWY